MDCRRSLALFKGDAAYKARVLKRCLKRDIIGAVISAALRQQNIRDTQSASYRVKWFVFRLVYGYFLLKSKVWPSAIIDYIVPLQNACCRAWVQQHAADKAELTRSGMKIIYVKTYKNANDSVWALLAVKTFRLNLRECVYTSLC